ncbi:hypothetical protein ES707_15540 [subsurface metagenome]
MCCNHNLHMFPYHKSKKEIAKKNNGLSIVTVSMNRTSDLCETVRKLSQYPYHMEHVIIDWSSAPPITFNDLPRDKRIKLYRVSGEKKWHLTRAYNFGFRMANGAYILKADADALIDKEFFQNNEWQQINVFLANDPTMGDTFVKSLTGLFFVPRTRLLEIGGFNEYLDGWGYDDIDLFTRLRRVCNYQRINFTGIKTIPQSDEERIKNTIDAIYLTRNINPAAIKYANNKKNRWVAYVLRWSNTSSKSLYEKREEGDWIAKSIPKIPGHLLPKVEYVKRKAFVEYMLGIKIGSCSQEDVKRMEWLVQTKYRFIAKTAAILPRMLNKIIRVATINIARIKYKQKE